MLRNFFVGVYHNYETRSFDILKKKIADQVEWVEAKSLPFPPFDGVYRTPEDVIQGVLRRVDNNWENYSIKPEIYHFSGTSTVIIGTYAATRKSDQFKMQVSFCHYWEMKDEKITKFINFVISGT